MRIVVEPFPLSAQQRLEFGVEHVFQLLGVFGRHLVVFQGVGRVRDFFVLRRAAAHAGASPDALGIRRGQAGGRDQPAGGRVEAIEQIATDRVRGVMGPEEFAVEQYRLHVQRRGRRRFEGADQLQRRALHEASRGLVRGGPDQVVQGAEGRPQIGEQPAGTVEQVTDEMLQGLGIVALVVGVQGEHGVLERQRQANAQAQQREGRGGDGGDPLHAGPEDAADHRGAVDGGGVHVIQAALQLQVVDLAPQVLYLGLRADRVMA